MGKLEDLKPNARVKGVLADEPVTVVSVQWFGTETVELTYKNGAGQVANCLLFRSHEPALTIDRAERPWAFDADGADFRLVSEAHRISLAYLFDPLLAVHTSQVEPLPHQITAVYEAMLPRQPLRFLLADDPGAGKTIMAGLLIKELMARGDLKRCLIVCPGSLTDQWQDELYQRFHLPFEILTNDKLQAARSGNWFLENDLAIARLDKLSRNDDIQAKLAVPDGAYDLIVCDEAHKMSATFFGGDVNYTKRFKLGKLLSSITRHFLLMTATPHNGKEEDFQLFLSLLDGDRFEGRFRDGVHQVDVSDLMRRMVKENLVRFDGRPLFPERIATTLSYKLSAEEEELYRRVSDYVRQEFNRADALQNDGRVRTVGFALTILQRRLASSPEAIFQSLKRRRERLEQRLLDTEVQQRKALLGGPVISSEDLEDLEDLPEGEIEDSEETILDQATAASTIQELKTEIGTLNGLETLAASIRRAGTDTKWRQLSQLLTELFQAGGEVTGDATTVKPSPHQKLVIFTEHRDTLNYLRDKIATLLGRPESVVTIHGSHTREERNKTQDLFRNNAEVRVLLATDAAGEGINLQRAHLMVNYDLPWNPNRLEQRFGRIHRIGQAEVCHLWNLVADNTREGDVYRTLLEKIEEARKALGGKVFDVLGKLVFDGQPLRDLLIEAIRYGELPEVRARLNRQIDTVVDQAHLRDLLEERALAHDAMDASRVARVRADMERAEAQRLQPHFVESLFREAFTRLWGGRLREREPRRYEITHVPAVIREQARARHGNDLVLGSYERVVFEKSAVAPHGLVQAAFIAPGHPLLDAVLDLTLERHRDLLRRGTVLVDERDPGLTPRVLFYIEHAIRDSSPLSSGESRTVSKRMLYVELDEAGNARELQYAPYLDYRPLRAGEPPAGDLLNRPECAWITGEVEARAMAQAVTVMAPAHLQEVSTRRLAWIDKTTAAVKDRLTKEISYWDRRADELHAQEKAGRPAARLNSQEARRRADDLQTRLQRRLTELKRERDLTALPPVAIGGLVVVPIGLIAAMTGQPVPDRAPVDTQAAAARARAAVMAIERELGFTPVDREFERLGYDIESHDPAGGPLRFIEVKGRVAGADTVTVTRNEIMLSLNKPDQYILAIVEFLDERNHRVHYVRRPFRREPDFNVTSANYDLAALIAMGAPPS